MCAECGCGSTGNNHLEFMVKGYTEENAKEAEKALLGLPCVLHVHIHAHNGETFIDYAAGKTKLSAISGVFEKLGLEADI